MDTVESASSINDTDSEEHVGEYSGVATYGALGHVPPSSFGNSVHSAAVASFENYQRRTCIKFSSISPETR